LGHSRARQIIARNVIQGSTGFVERLLLSLDRLRTNELSMTQDLITNMLGVRREGGYRGRREAAAGRADPLREGDYYDAQSPGTGSEMLRGYQVVKTEFDRLLPDIIKP
jgi:hypothetical protein